MSATQAISPVLVYDDAEEAIRFLTEAFGFTEHAVHRTSDGAIAHAELAYGGGFVGLSDRIEGAASVFDLGPCAIYVVVDDPDAHHSRAVAAGADVVFPLTDQDYGSRDYAVRDAEGFVWCFGTYVPGSHPSPT
ncbi:MAG: VOC family protein [Acidimicrobiia bacterium]